MWPPQKLHSHLSLFSCSAIEVKVKVKFTLEHTMKAQRGSRGKLYSFFNLGARWGGWSRPCPGHFTPGKDTIPMP
jgi:hypothetical protein